MGLRIKTNVDSLVSQRRLEENRKGLGESLERLSSGLRINKSADDAAGLAVSERIRGRVSSLGVAKRNASDGISYIQVAEGGLNEVTNILIRMRELATQAASDTLGARERSFLDKEFVQLRDEVGRIVESTDFNGSKVLQPGDGDKP
ncbi:MAG: flagellin FliC, partial [Proteobacteria bacterium]|nr:flagellin FliC [Pseudomonadota bacterium]